jgi:hypothetical protein
MSSIDRLREKIESYVELLNRIRSGECSDHDDAKVLEILRPLIFIHWRKQLRQVPEAGWKDVCVEIAKIDKARDQANKSMDWKMALQQQQEEDDRCAAEALVAEFEAAEKLAAEEAILKGGFDDQNADLLFFHSLSDELPDFPPARHTRFNMSAWLDEDDDSVF